MSSSVDQLKQKIDHLISLSEQLHSENKALRERENNLLKERSKLVEKNDLARTRVEAMIHRLKSLEVDG